MLRQDNLYFTHNGTGGTGTLTLAHVTGGGDPYLAWGGTMPTGFSATHIVPYKIIEYTGDITTGYFTPKNVESGFGTLTIGASVGATTLARTTVQDTYVEGTGYAFGTALSIGATAANVRIFLGPGVADNAQVNPYFESSLGDASGVMPHFQQGAAGTFAVNNNQDVYVAFDWRIPMLVKKATVRVTTAYTGGTPVSNAGFRIYEFGSNGRPGRLLIDLGLLGTSNASLNATGLVSTAVATTGLYLTPGEYIANLFTSFSGGTSSPAVGGNAASAISSPRFGTSSLSAFPYTTAGSGSLTAPDPANVTSYAGGSGAGASPRFLLSPS